MIADLVATLSRSTILLPGTSILNSLILASTFSVMSCRDAGKEALPPPASVPTDSSIARAGTSTTPVDSSATASTANIQDECTRGTPIKVFAPSVPGVVWSKFELTSNTSSEELVAFSDGDTLFFENGGCEYYANTFTYTTRTRIRTCVEMASYIDKQLAFFLKEGLIGELVDRDTPRLIREKLALECKNPLADGIDIPYGNADMPSRLVIEDSTLSRLGIQSDSTRAPAKVRFMLQIGPL